MIEYILAVVILAAVIVFLSGSGKPRNRGPRTSESYSDVYPGVYSHGPRSPDAEVHFPVRKDSTALFPMNKRKERKRTKTFQNKQ